MSHAPVSRPGRLAVMLSLALPALGGCSNVVPGPYVDPPLPDAGPGGDMSVPERTGTLRVTPGLQQQLAITDGSPATASWRAFFTYADTGEDVDVTDSCFWSLVGREGQRTPLGSVDRGRFTSTPLSAGAGKVRAEFMGQRAEADFSIKLAAARLSTADDGSAPPADAAARFGGAISGAKAPRLQYPPDNAILPTGMGGLMVQWARQGGTDLHEVRIAGDLLDLRIYTSSPQRLSLGETELTLLTDSALYGPVTVTVRGATTAGDSSIGVSASSTLRAAAVPAGATYYFSTAAAQGVWRYSWSAPYGTAAAPYATTQTAATGLRCVGCHAVSADGGGFIGSYDMSALGSGTIVDVKSGTARTVSATLRWFSSALSGDGQTAILSGSGALSQIQTQSGSGATPLPSGVIAGVTIPAMPALSPDGKRLLFVRGRQVSGQSEVHVYNGSIVLMTDQNGALGNPTDIVTAAGNDNNYYPTLSPDAQWVIFNRTSSATPAAADSYDNLTAALWAVPLDRSRAPLRLNQANDGYLPQIPANAGISSSTISNSYPAFLPFVGQMDGRPIYFFTFASRRHYGGEIIRNGAAPRASTSVVRGRITPAQDTTLSAWNQQLWIAAFDPQKVALGVDPSSAALWLPFQAPTTSNHMAVNVQAFAGPAL